jgi:hypothetical protein
VGLSVGAVALAVSNDRKCAVDGCDGTRHAKKMCNVHYLRVKQFGSLEKTFQRPAAVRFWEKVMKTDKCWLWTGGQCNKYGLFWIGKPTKNIFAHRWSYEAVFGPIAAGLQVDHLCRQTLCVRPDHLEAVTPLVNNLRMMKHRMGQRESLS